MSIIEALKQNKMAFGLMETPDFTNEAMQEKAREIGQPEFEMYMKNDTWLSCGSIDNFSCTSVTDMTYRLRPDYEEEGVVKCHIVNEGETLCFYRTSEVCFYLDEAPKHPDFIGYLYEGGVVSSLPRIYKYNAQWFTWVDANLLDTYEVLTPTHVLFSS